MILTLQPHLTVDLVVLEAAASPSATGEMPFSLFDWLLALPPATTSSFEASVCAFAVCVVLAGEEDHLRPSEVAGEGLPVIEHNELLEYQRELPPLIANEAVIESTLCLLVMQETTAVRTALEKQRPDMVEAIDSVKGGSVSYLLNIGTEEMR